LQGVMRISDAIRIANDGNLPSLNEFNYREIVCKNGDSTRFFDLFPFFFNNIELNNPYIYPGDNIALYHATSRVFINGAIKGNINGFVPVLPHENLGSFLSFFKYDASADTTHIIYQTGENLFKRKTILLQNAYEMEIHLKDHDVITIPRKPEYTESYFVSVNGAVSRPGIYPIQSNYSTIEELLSTAGGTTEKANATRSFIIRHDNGLFGKIRGRNQDLSAIFKPEVSFIRPEYSVGFIRAFTTNDYSIISIHDVGMDFKIEPSDEIFVPEISNLVYLSGNVKKPGAVHYKKGAHLSYYIKEAGGLTNQADKANILIVGRFADYLQIKSKKDIQEDDIIIVPDRQENKLLRTLILPGVQAIATTIAAIVAIITVVK